jgi:amino acid transporter
MDLSKLCTPAMLYLVLAAISIVIGVFQKFQFFSLLVKVVFVAAWTWFLNFLCSKGYKAISWFLVLLPFLMMICVFVMAMEVVKSSGTSNMPPPAMQKTPQERVMEAMGVMPKMGGSGYKNM